MTKIMTSPLIVSAMLTILQLIKFCLKLVYLITKETTVLSQEVLYETW